MKQKTPRGWPSGRKDSSLLVLRRRLVHVTSCSVLKRLLSLSGPCQYWRAEAYVVVLKNAADPWEGGLIYPIVRLLESGKCPPALFSAPLIRAVVGFKWQWARNVIFVEFCLFFFWLTAFLVHASLYKPGDLEGGFWERLDANNSESVSIVASFLATVFMLPFSYISTCEVVYNGLGHWFTFWNLFDALAQICQMLCFAVYFFTTDVEPNTYAIMLSTQTVLLVLKIQYFARSIFRFIVSVNNTGLQGCAASRMCFHRQPE